MTSAEKAPPSKLEIRRLKKREDFLKARHGARSHERAFVLQARDRADGTRQIRFGFTATRKVGNAVVRNRIKRRLREVVRTAGESELLPMELAGFDVVVVARIGTLEEPFEKLTSSLVAGLKAALSRQKNSAEKPVVAKHRPSGQKQRGGGELAGVDKDSGHPVPSEPPSD